MCSLLGSAVMSVLCAQNEIAFANARVYAMGAISSVISGIANPSFSSFLSHKQLELNYINRFGLKELSTFSVSFQYPNPWLDGAVYLSRYGFTEYNETRFSLNLSHRLSKKWSFGARINYNRLHYSEEYSDKGIITTDLGTLIEPIENRLRIGCMIYNPLQSGIRVGEDEEEERLPVTFTVGVSYRLCRQIVVMGEVGKQNNSDAQCRFGMEYQPFSVFCVRGGIQSSPFSPSFGMGLFIKDFEVNMGFVHYSSLGVQSICSLQYSF